MSAARDERKVRVRAVSNIVDVIGSTVELKQRGREWWGRCPFHDDKSPSFSVNPAKGVYSCFGCDAKGDVFDFVQQHEGLNFAQAVEWLERRAGIPTGQDVPPRSPLVRTHPAPTPEPARVPPPQAEVRALWALCTPAHEDPQVFEWATSRGLDPVTVADREFARALPLDGALPRWAGMGDKDWRQTHHLCVLPLFDHAGTLTSLHARSIELEPKRKALFPQGCAMAELVMADDAALLMLRTGELLGELWIVEGAPGYLAATTSWGDAADPAPATIGIANSSWTKEIAAKVPDGSRVVIATDEDEKGEAYRANIVETLKARCTLERWRVPA